MPLGTLIQPFVIVEWGDIKLTPFETDSLKIPESVITGASVNLSYAEQGASASLTFRSDPIGYEAYRKCMENSTNKVKIKFGYENGAETPEFLFLYTGASLETGLNQSIQVELSSEATFQLSDVRGTSVINSNEEDVPLKEVIETAKVRLGSDVSVIYSSYFDKTTVRQTYLIGDNFKDFLQRTCQETGHTLQELASKEKTVELAPPAQTDVKEKPPKEPPKKGERKESDKYGFLIGPGLITTFSSSVKYNPPSNTRGSTGSVPESSGLKETDTSKKEKKEKGPSSKGGTSKKPNEKPEKEVQKKQTTLSTSILGSDTDSVTSENKIEKEKKGADLRKERSSTQEMSGSISLFMIPAITGIVPRDVIFIPSLTGKYVEDWFVTGTNYNFSSGGVTIDITCKRVDESEGTIVEDKSKFLELAKSLDSPEAWNAYYWSTK